MPDSYVRIRQGEKRPIYGQIAAATGTFVIQTSPAASVTLYDANGTGVTSFIGVAVTGYDSGSQASPRLWLLLDTASLAAGWYSLVFIVTATNSDGTTRKYTPTVEVEIMDVGK